MKLIHIFLNSLFFICFILNSTFADEYQDTQELKGSGELGYLGRGLFLGLEGEYKDPGTIGGEVSFYYLIPEKNPYSLLTGRLSYDFTGFELGLGGGGYFSEGGGGVGPSLSLRIGPKDFFYLTSSYDSADTFTNNPFVRLSFGAGAKALSGSQLWIGYTQEGWPGNSGLGSSDLYLAGLQQELYDIIKIDGLKNIIATIELGFRVGDGGGIVLNFGGGYKLTDLTGDSLAQSKLDQGRGLEDSQDWDGATLLYQEVINDFPETIYGDEARFRLGEVRRRKRRSREEAQRSLQSLKELADKFGEGVYDAQFRYQQGIAAIEEGKWIEAYESLDSLITKYPSDPLTKEAEYWIEYILSILSEYDRIRLELRAFLDNYPRVELSDDAHYRLARSYYDQGDYHRAIETFDRFSTDFPESELLWLADYDKGLAFQSLGDWERSLDSYLDSFSLAKPGRSLSDFEEASTTFPDRIITDDSLVYDRLNYRIGSVQWNLGKFDESVDSFLKVKPGTLPGEDSDDLVLKLGYAYFNLEDYRQTLERLDEAISRAGDISALPPLVSFMVGRSHEAGGGLDKAADAYLRFLDRNPGDLMSDEARMRLGYVYLKTGSYDQALAPLTASLAAATDESVEIDIRYRLGFIYHLLEKWEEVIDTYEIFLAEYGTSEYDLTTDSESPYYPLSAIGDIIYKNEVFLRLGDAYFNSADYARALASYLDLLARSQDLPVREWARHQVGISYDRLARWAEAVNAYETFLANYPESNFVDQARLRLGFGYFHVTSYEEALDEFRYSLTRAWDDNTITLLEYKVGQTLERLGRWEEALAAHEGFITKHPEDFLVGNALTGIGDAYRNLGQFDQALGSYLEATTRFPTSSTSDDAQLNIGRIYLNRGDFSDALVELQKVLKNYPQRDSVPEAELLLGITFRGLGDDRRALGILNQIIDKYPQDRGIVEEAEREISEIQGGTS